MLHFMIILEILIYYMDKIDIHKPITREITRDEFFVKTMTHFLGSPYSRFGGKS